MCRVWGAGPPWPCWYACPNWARSHAKKPQPWPGWESGAWQGQRRIEGGRARLRRSLYAAALPAAYKWNPGLVALYQRLIQAGKPHKVALVACARKLLIYANAVVQRQQKWSPQNTPL